MTGALPSALSAPPTAGWLDPASCELADLVAIVETGRAMARPVWADQIIDGVPFYRGDQVSKAMTDGSHDLQTEMIDVLLNGAGIVVVQGAFADHAVVDRVTAAFFEIIAEQKALGAVAGDHFAKPGANDRVWNALEKLAIRNPESFAQYYANDTLAFVSAAWLGPAYQVTSQVNVVNPGGGAQAPHRDYHLGFQSNDVCRQYPQHVHVLSQVLTLQGAIAHCDMPLETGPTLYLPHSQKYVGGYLAWRRDDFTEYFEQHKIQLSLAKGDAVFFNPAVHHAAGSNRTTDVRRVANLVQISSAFGRAMESIDRQAMCNALYPFLRTMAPGRQRGHVVAACAEGYAFPTNLDRDQPVDGLAPPTQADLLLTALADNWQPDSLRSALADQLIRTLP